MSTGADPTLGDVISRVDALERTVTAMDRTLGLEMRALRAELTLAISQLGSDLRVLWTEHLAHSHPDEQP
jgi:hypothetical protein